VQVCAISQCRATRHHRKALRPRYRRHYRRSAKPWARHVMFRHWPRQRVRFRRHRGGRIRATQAKSGGAAVSIPFRR
jgi:hypothetical protein